MSDDRPSAAKLHACICTLPKSLQKPVEEWSNALTSIIADRKGVQQHLGAIASKLADGITGEKRSGIFAFAFDEREPAS